MNHLRDDLVLLCESATAVALSVLLGTMRLVELPSGGSVTLAALPLLVLAVSRGVRVGVLAGGCAGLAHALSGGMVIHPAQLLLDYVLAYSALGLAGRVRIHGRVSRRSLAPGITLAMTLQFACAVLSGVIFFAPVAGTAAVWYSVAYNATTFVPELVLAVILTAPLLHALARANPADAWRRGLLPVPYRDARTPRRYHPPAGTPMPAPQLQVKATSPHATRTAFIRPAPFGARRSTHRPAAR